MLKKLIKRLSPKMHEMRTHPQLKYLNTLIHKENLWHVNRNSIANAFAVGLFCVFIPVPFQMIPAAFIAVWVGANIPVSVLLVWISNPFTVAPIFYLCYKLGQLILQTPVSEFHNSSDMNQIMETMPLWQPFLLGCLVMSCVSSIIGYTMVKVLWRIHILSYLKQRRIRRNNALNAYKNK